MMDLSHKSGQVQQIKAGRRIRTISRWCYLTAFEFCLCVSVKLD